MEKITDSIDKIKHFFNIEATVQFVEFLDRKNIPKKCRGIYIILEGEEVLYVGKGNIASRQKQHLAKITNQLAKYFVEPKGWKWLRTERKAVPDNWKFIMIFTNTKSEETAMEGALIHMLKPTVNDEIFGQK
jgi:hypothetical protein